MRSRDSHNAMLADWRGHRTGKRASLGMYFDCSRYRGEQVTAEDCRSATKGLCNECAIGGRLRFLAKKSTVH